MKEIIKIIFSVSFLGGVSLATQAFPANDVQMSSTNYQVCFTPGGSCTQNIINAIDAAKSQILVQSFLFTSKPIANALVAAHKRGVDVKVIFDKHICVAGKKNICKFLIDSGIPVVIDDKVTIAHNKIMIIDQQTVITGSFNFTNAAQNHNAENSLIIRDSALAKKYIDNWNGREQQSVAAAI